MLIFSALRHGRSISTFLISFVLGGAFIWVAWKTGLIWSIFLLYLMVVLGVVRAFRDWRAITYLARNEPEKHDAAKMAMVTGKSASFWANVWSITTFLLIGIAFWFTWLRNLAG
ncbi:MAG: M50 family metallopeptidase [Anaerolineae bacterium]|nr:M50 family metallopeptidase [Anaerolineae bacterium]